ncbi:hypothetical protein B0H21DRAFT_355921 [Amylocystis lapponica]|nr:hypothetical protein B0H21DRAFT_355921 [Amylocystis lapponica]
MSAQLSSPVQISSGASTSSEPLANIPCAICRRQFSKYSCPRCNIPYCSLTCFRSEVRVPEWTVFCRCYVIASLGE